MGCPFERPQNIAITYAFQKILDKSNCTSSKIWADKGCEYLRKIFFC